MSEVTSEPQLTVPPEHPPDAPNGAVWTLTAVMAAVSASIVVGPFGADFTVAGAPTWQWWALIPVFAVAEVLVVHLPSIRSAHSHTLREIPALIGLAFLAPAEYVSAYIIGAGVALVVWSRLRGVKLGFNLAMYALEATVGLVTYVALLGGSDPTSWKGWVAALCAVLVTDLLSAAAVTTAMSLTDGRFDAVLLVEALRSGVVAAVVNTCMALLVIVLIVRAPAALPLMVVIVLMLLIAYRTYISLATGYARLALLHEFIGSSGHQTELDAVINTTLTEAVRIMRAQRCVLLLMPVEGEEKLEGQQIELVDGTIRRSTFDVTADLDAWWSPTLGGGSVLRRHESGQSTRAGPRDGIAVPLQVGGSVDGVLLVTDRSFEAETFHTEDQRLFETLAGHVAVNLDKARLVDRLRRLADERRHEARHDALTDLPNRLAFREALDGALRLGVSGAVLLLDLDDFKDVNDTLGHDAGAKLLRVTARRLASEDLGMVARLGGDEFAVLLPSGGVEDAVETARRLLRIVSAPTALADVNLTTTASVGIAPFTGVGGASDDVLAQADVAMHSAKRGHKGLEVHRPADTTAIRRRLELAAALPAALHEGSIQAWYQPQADAIDGRIVGVEALLRWTHPVHGPIPPPEVVALAVRTGLLTSLTSTILEQALRRRASLADSGQQLDMSVNVCPGDLLEGSLPTTVARLLADTGTPASALTIEITESDVMTDPESCLAVLDELARIGVKVSVDDFGIGHSSLAYLDRLPVDEVKIDRSFVQRVERLAADSTILRATVALAHDLGLCVVAEGVENDTALRRVTAVGCDRIQGYGLARPMTGAMLEGWLRARDREGTLA
jgi:diguanylate cyclase (GGDEF)-like protein